MSNDPATVTRYAGMEITRDKAGRARRVIIVRGQGWAYGVKTALILSELTSRISLAKLGPRGFYEMIEALKEAGIPRMVIEVIGIPFGIGQFMMEWSKHERMLASLIATLENKDYEFVLPVLLDGHISEYEKRRKVAASRLDESHPSQIFLSKIIVGHSKLRDARHNIVHGHWSGINDKETLVLQRKRRGMDQTSRPFSVEELAVIISDLQKLFMPIVNASQAFRGEPVMSWNDKQVAS